MPATDPRFLDATLDEMMADYYAHLYFEDPKAAEETYEDDDFDVDSVASAIGVRADGDVDDWETL